jgi:hypothetical protein
LLVYSQLPTIRAHTRTSTQELLLLLANVLALKTIQRKKLTPKRENRKYSPRSESSQCITLFQK